jgi:5-methylcytosine-specific restriction endonuclease McrA
MLRDATIQIHDDSTPTWAHATERRDWRTVDRALRSNARRRAALDADEARLLREAESLQIWKPLGMVNALDYMERVLGYGPRVAQERLRVARALGDLPEMTEALERGALSFSAARELTRVATRGTEAEWIVAAREMNLREIEELVAGHRPGDLPEDPPDPDVRNHVVQLELKPETYALLRQARAQLEEEHGRHLDDDAFVAALAASALESTRGEPSGHARYEIAVTLCERCHQGWQHGAGAKLAISTAAVERAECDARHVGSIDASVPARAHQDVAPAVARLVWRRDNQRCRVPGCRSARGLEIHHIVHRADGGSHEATNLVLLCSACHQAHHDGKLVISGTADELDVHRAHVGATIEAEAKQALVGLGWKPAIARAAVEQATRAVEPTASLEDLIREALRRCR